MHWYVCRVSIVAIGQGAGLAATVNCGDCSRIFSTDWCYDGRISILCPPVCRRQVVSDVFLVTLLAIYILVDRQNGSLFQQNNEQEPSIMSEIEHQVNPTVELHEQIMRMWSETAPLLT